MEKVKKLQSAVLAYLENYAEGYRNAPDGLETQLIADELRGHFQLLRVGWSDKKFVHFCVFHFDIKDQKIWVQVNETEELIIDELTLLGVSASDVVLGFQPVYHRLAA